VKLVYRLSTTEIIIFLITKFMTSSDRFIYLSGVKSLCIMVYEPREDSYFLLGYVKKLVYGRVLDMGTGSGILALGAAEKKSVDEVVAVDIDKDAVTRLRRKEQERLRRAGENKTSKLRVYESDLFTNIQGRFDVIILNPPYLPLDEKDKDIALDGGVKGYELIEMFLKQAKKHLAEKGFILMVFSNRTGKEEVDKIIKREGYKSELLGSKSLAFFEELYVYKISLSH